MCKNSENPCPGCKKHKKTDPVWMFFTDEECGAFEGQSNHSTARANTARP